jgi:hypothetical protein
MNCPGCKDKDFDGHKCDKCGYRLCKCEKQEAFEHRDGYGIFCGYMCDACFNKEYRSDIIENYFDASEAGECLEPNY